MGECKLAREVVRTADREDGPIGKIERYDGEEFGSEEGDKAGKLECWIRTPVQPMSAMRGERGTSARAESEGGGGVWRQEKGGAQRAGRKGAAVGAPIGPIARGLGGRQKK